MTKFYRYFFTRSELRGILYLSGGVILIRLLSFYIVPTVPLPDQSGGGVNAPDPHASLSPAPRTDPSGAQSPTRKRAPVRQAKPTIKILEINSADSTALETLPGIGPSFARRIVKYRQMLGGYAEKSQLLEVYGMDTIRFNGFSDRIRIDRKGIRKLDINRATFRELLAHPYLEYEQVKAVVRFRDRKGRFESPDELWAKGVLPDSLKSKLGPYLIAGMDSSATGKEVLEK